MSITGDGRQFYRRSDAQHNLYMQRIILVNPPLSMKERYGKLSAAGICMPPLGLCALAASMRQRGHTVSLLDCEALSLGVEQAVNRIIAFKPDLVGITAATVAIHSAGALAARLKSIDHALFIVIGGVHMSALPRETMESFPHFDAGVIGEGEDTLGEILVAREQGTPLLSVNGLMFWHNGELHSTSARKTRDNIDSFPFPAWDLLPDIRRHYHPALFSFRHLPSLSIVTSRGCPYLCTFCSRAVWGDRCYREHSAEYVFGMMKTLVQDYGIRDVQIYDDTFGVNRVRVLSLCDLLIREKLPLTWSCNLRENIIDENVLAAMKRAGCWQIGFGIESGSADCLEFLHKEINPEMVTESICKIRAAGIICHGYFMLGTLPETETSLEKTKRFILNSDLDFLTLNIFTPMPGSIDYQRAQEYGTFKKDWRLLNQYSYVFVPRGLSSTILARYAKSIVARFYLRLHPRVLWHFLTMPLSIPVMKTLLNGIVAFLIYITQHNSSRAQ